MTCMCPQCTPNPAPTYTEAWRMECEARYIAQLTTDEERRVYLNLVRTARGDISAEALRTLAWKEMKRRSAITTKPSET